MRHTTSSWKLGRRRRCGPPLQILTSILCAQVTDLSISSGQTEHPALLPLNEKGREIRIPDANKVLKGPDPLQRDGLGYPQATWPPSLSMSCSLIGKPCNPGLNPLCPSEGTEPKVCHPGDPFWRPCLFCEPLKPGRWRGKVCPTHSAQAGTGAFWGDLSSTSEPQFLHGKMRMILTSQFC